MWNFLHPSPTNTTITTIPPPAHPPIPQESQLSYDSGATPPSMLLQHAKPVTQNSSMQPDTISPTMHQQLLRTEQSNELWGDAWVLEKPTSLF